MSTNLDNVRLTASIFTLESILLLTMLDAKTNMVDSPCVPSRPPFFIGIILQLMFVAGGTFPARRFTASSR